MISRHTLFPRFFKLAPPKIKSWVRHCRTASWLFFKTEPPSGTPRFGRCKASKCPFHMSSINRTCAAHQGVYTTNGVQSVYFLYNCKANIGGADLTHTWPNKCCYLVRLSIAPWTRAIRSSPDITGVPYAILFKLPHRSDDHGTGPALPIHWFGYVTLRWFRTFLS